MRHMMGSSIALGAVLFVMVALALVFALVSLGMFLLRRMGRWS